MKFNGILANGVSRISEIPLELQAFQHLAAKIPHFTGTYQQSHLLHLLLEFHQKITPNAEMMIFEDLG